MKTKTITLKNGDLFGLVPFLSSLAAKELPVMGSYKLAKTIKVLQAELDEVMTLRESVAKKHAARNDAGEPEIQNTEGGLTYQIPEDNQEHFIKEVNTLLEVSHDLEICELLVSDLGNITVKTSDLIPLIELGILSE